MAPSATVWRREQRRPALATSSPGSALCPARSSYAGADAAVLPSHSEGSPNALLEAAAYRLPIVATAVGGVADTFVHGRSGLLVPPRRPAALAAALGELLTDPSRSARLGQEARRVVETRRPSGRADAGTHCPLLGDHTSAGRTVERRSIRMRVWMVLHAPPCSPALGPARRHLHLFEEISRRHRVSIVTLGTSLERERFEREHAGRYERATFIARRPRALEIAVASWYTLTLRCTFRRLYLRSVQQAIDRAIARDRLDTIYLSTVMLGCYHLPAGVRVIGDTHNVEYEVLARAASIARNPLRRAYYRLQARVARRDEEQFSRRVSEVWATCARDAERFALVRGDGKVAVVPNGIRCEDKSAAGTTRNPRAMPTLAPVLLFVGLMSYFPNRDAAIYFLDEIFPFITSRLPSARFLVIGANPSRRLRARAERNVTIVGRVPDVAPYFAQASVFVAPLRAGGGTRVKYSRRCCITCRSSRRRWVARG